MRVAVIDQTQQKENNLSIVLRRLMRDPECTRVKLAAQTGLAPATVTKIVSLLMHWGIVSEQKSVRSGVGRRALRLHLNSEAFISAAVRVNRDNICAALVDMGGQVIADSRCGIGFEEGPETSFEKLKAMLSRLMNVSPTPVCAIGVAVPGPYSYRTGRISLMSGFPGWDRIDIRGELVQAFHLPVFVEHDANCGAIAEFWSRDMNNPENLLFVVADMGVGAGMILESQLYRGKDGFAGEIGHASICFDGPLCECGNRGCLELYASISALQRNYARKTGTNSEAEEILAKARQGEPAAMEVYTEAVHALAYGIVSTANIINPNAIVFYGRLTEGGDIFLKTMWEVFRQRLMPEQAHQLILQKSTLSEDPMLVGAGIMAFSNMLENPSCYFGRKTR